MSVNVKLGKKLGVVHDPRTFKLAPLLAVDITAPLTFHFGHGITNFPMLGNDDFGCCTCAAMGHRVIASEYNTGQKERWVNRTQVLNAYSAVTGFKQDDPSTDNGAYCLDVLNYMRRTGLGREVDGTRHMIYAYASVDWRDHTEAKVASYVFGGLYTGVALPLSAADQINTGQRWDVVSSGRAEWGSWGGHAMHTVGYDDLGPIFVTWGQLQRSTWAWWDKYVDEAYAVLHEDWIRVNTGKTTNAKLDLSQLNEQLARL